MWNKDLSEQELRKIVNRPVLQEILKEVLQAEVVWCPTETWRIVKKAGQSGLKTKEANILLLEKILFFLV